jgi:3-hydroxyisobutyrate dehydrogenase-like beta-hydroxyacid dehydrogenase
MTTDERTVGMIGLGIMGAAVSQNLIARGFTVVGFDVSSAAVEAFGAMGGQPVRSAREVADAAAIVITSLPSVKALRETVAAVCASTRPGQILVETSTFRLADKEQARDDLAASGISMLDCPLSGSGSQAKVRDVLVYASGDRADYDRCLPVFEGFSRAPHYLGDFGNGSKMKFVANLLVAIHTAAAGEAFALARKCGLDPAQMFDVVSDGAGGSRALAVRGQMLIDDCYLPVQTMPLDLWRKDMSVISEFAATLACPTPMFSATVPLFNAAVASGFGQHDTAAVCAVIEQMAGLPGPSKT